MTIPVVIVGATGYSGAELVEILLGHAGARIAGLFGSSRRAESVGGGTGGGGAATMADLFPRFRGRIEEPIKAAEIGEILALRPRAVFLATPHEASVELAAGLLGASAGARPVVFDLSGAFRLRPASQYPRHYGFEHAHPELLERAVYGLPEANRAALVGADLVAVPGCYPTSAIIPLRALARAGAIDGSRRVIVDSVSGVSGAGRTAAVKSLFCEVSMQAYNVLKHRHNPEIDQYSGVATVFTAHLGPYDRGILSTIHVELGEGGREGWSEERVRGVLREAYGREPFVRLLPRDAWPSVAGVRGTNFC
ncbi:MAG: N-acetyl-gamma-glutamyl-phosphate reductase, partial [Phycisphaerales bacterium]